jgi:hypothetical protein
MRHFAPPPPLGPSFRRRMGSPRPLRDANRWNHRPLAPRPPRPLGRHAPESPRRPPLARFVRMARQARPAQDSAPNLAISADGPAPPFGSACPTRSRPPTPPPRCAPWKNRLCRLARRAGQGVAELAHLNGFGLLSAPPMAPWFLPNPHLSETVFRHIDRLRSRPPPSAHRPACCPGSTACSPSPAAGACGPGASPRRNGRRYAVSACSRTSASTASA